MDYRRFISYLYSYQGEEKGVNVGYIRCEQRQGFVRFTLSLNDHQGIEDGRYKVYLYQLMEDRTPVGYILDEVLLHNHSADLRLQTTSRNVWNTGKQLNEFDGVMLVYDADHKYMSQWSDREVVLADFVTWQDYSNIRKQEQITADTGAGVAARVQADDERAETAGHVQTDDGRTGAAGHVQTDDEGTGAAGHVQTDDERAETAVNIQTNGEEAETNVHVKIAGQDTETSKNLHSVKEKEYEDISVEFASELRADPMKAISPMTLQLMENRPKLPDFENHEIYDCVRIIPNDIGMLEMENWRLGVNSFLTHGYYNYKYLLLGKLRFQDGVVKAVLGVPGIYDNKEQYIAKIFGFDVFVPVKHTNIKTGNFGYWITELV